MRRAPWLTMILILTGAPAAAAADGVEAEVRKASAGYAEAYNKRDYQALAAQWAERAELVEGGARVAGRDAIVASIRGWLERHPQARSSSAAAGLDDLAWLVGSWQATDAKEGTTVTLTYEKAVGGHALIGRTKIVPKQGDTIETIDVIHADRATGRVRSWLFDSTGARAEGVFSSDGMAFNRTFAGTPADGAGRTAWTQVIVPGGEGRFTIQSIDRSLDGQPLPDHPPLHFKKLR